MVADLNGPTGDYVGTFHRTDPRTILANAIRTGGRDGYVMVKVDEIRAVIRMRVCRSSQVFNGDEDGSMQPMLAHCVLKAGHHDDHSNGYFSWRTND